MDPRGPAADEIRTIAERSRGAIAELREGLARSATQRSDRLRKMESEATALIARVSERIASELAAEFARKAEEQRQESLADTDVARQQLDADRAALDADRVSLQAEREAWLREQADRESEAGALEAGRAELDAQREAVRKDRAALDEKEKAFASERAAWLAEKADWERVRDQVEAELSKREQAIAVAASQGDDTPQRLAEAHGRMMEFREALEEANRRLTAAAEAETEHAALREKFEIALADLRQHREHVASLEEELAKRPAEDAAATAELNRLREERDDLARRLEEALAAPPQADSVADYDDLQRRFEMAVEDLRAVRQENGELKDRLATAPAAEAATDGDDWESQKRRLLASLEGEGDTGEPARKEERATILGTVQITDEVVACKDREIERLRGLVGGGAADGEAVDAVLDQDELVRAERERLAELEAEWRDKLRAAELELSVERARIARAQSELAEQQIELETLRAQAANEAPGDGESRRKWLSKLGLGGDQGA